MPSASTSMTSVTSSDASALIVMSLVKICLMCSAALLESARTCRCERTISEGGINKSRLTATLVWPVLVRLPVPNETFRDGPVVLIFDFEKQRLRKTEVSGNHVARKRLDQDIHIAHRAVVVTPGQLNLILGIAEIVLQTDEILICLEVRIGFGDREQAPKAAVSSPSFRPRSPISLIFIVCCAQTRDGLQSDSRSWPHNPLTVSTRLGNQIGAAFQLGLDAAPSFINKILVLDQAGCKSILHR